ncbi:Hpt domain-containing protein, partial [Cronbergia sp. UHCC 0137]|uniref:Hpt domain-containing protein n=1 Tax=Cronbergia sp. UHCC 0137 TaxID=3110239 RepID=UPI002B205C38
MQPEQQQRILGYFLEEAREYLNTIEQGLLNLQATLNDTEMINEVFRAAHSMKGSAAMLGLNSIQHTAHRLEDSFKTLREHPVKVDQQLESLFLGVTDTLKDLLDQLGSPFGLSEESAKTLMLENEPFFRRLNEHLEELLAQQKESGAEIPVANVDKITIQKPAPTTVAQQVAPIAASQKLNRTEFQGQVLQVLREMLQLFKQSNVPSSREKLQECCDKLDQLGKKWGISNWCVLCQTASRAIANPDNTYLILAKTVITEIKQAQELILQGKEAEITISQPLKALEPVQEIELLELKTDLVDKQPQTAVIEPIHSQLELKPKSQLVQPPQPVSTQLPPTPTLGTLITPPEDKIIFTDNNITHNGPEVGIAELNTLADLFDGETSELDETWQKEQILDNNITNQLGSGDEENDENDSDLADLLSLDDNINNVPEPSIVNITEDLNSLFEYDFLEKDNLESENQIILANPTQNTKLILEELENWDADDLFGSSSENIPLQTT